MQKERKIREKLFTFISDNISQYNSSFRSTALSLRRGTPTHTTLSLAHIRTYGSTAVYSLYEVSIIINMNKEQDTTTQQPYCDDFNNPICFKFHGYNKDFSLCTKKGKCRWRKKCSLSHKTPNKKTSERLEKQHQLYLQNKQQELEQQLLRTQEEEAPTQKKSTPLWFEKVRSRLIFSTIHVTNTSSSSSFDLLQNALASLLQLTWSINDKQHNGIATKTLRLAPTSSSSTTFQDMANLHQSPKFQIDENIMPVCPAVVQMHRLMGKTLPLSWETYYKQPKKMFKLMRATDVYKHYIQCYRTFVREIILPQFQGEAIWYQCPATLRIHPPGLSPTIGLHKDSDYSRHEAYEINYWIPLTKVFGNNTLWVESLPGKSDFAPVELEAGKGFRFNGNECRHFTKANDTKCTRVSFDFRVIPLSIAERPNKFDGKIGDYTAEVMEQIH